jgi:hypothetical protein
VTIGAAVGLASVFKATIISPISAVEPGNILALGGLASGAGMDDPIAWWKQTPGLARLALYRTGDADWEVNGQERQWIRATEVSGDFFDIFEAKPVFGRFLTRSDELADERIAVVRQDFWRQIGKAWTPGSPVVIRLNGESYQIVGVVHSSFTFPSLTQVWLPRTHSEYLRVALLDGVAGLAPTRSAGGWVARPHPGTTIPQVREQLSALLASANTTLTPKTGIRYGDVVGVEPLIDVLTRNVKPQLTTLLEATFLMAVLVLGQCAVYSATRAFGRQYEFALKYSLGASPRAIHFEIVLDSMVMAACCVAFGVAAAYVVATTARQFLFAYRAYVPPLETILGSTLALSATAGLVISLVASIPSVVVVRRLAISAMLMGDGAARTPGHLRALSRRVFVVCASCAATILAAGAITADQVFYRLRTQSLGYSPDQVVASRLVFPRRELDGPSFRARREEVMQALRSVGSQAAVARMLPIEASQRGFTEVRTNASRVMAQINSVDGDFFQVMNINVIAGRADALSDGGTVAVNRSLARLLESRSESALDHTLGLGGSNDSWRVGEVVEDTRTVDQGERAVYEIYRPFAEIDGKTMPSAPEFFEALSRCAVNCNRDLPRVIDAVRNVGAARIARVDTLSHMVATARGGSTVAAIVWSGYAFVAVGIACVGVLTMVVDSILRRRIEISIRLALGASPDRLVRQLVREALWASIVGASLGMVGARMGATAIRAVNRIAEVPGLPVLVAVASCVVVMSVVAAWIPARRASTVNPTWLMLRTRVR